MSLIWTQPESARAFEAANARRGRCLYCRSRMTDLCRKSTIIEPMVDKVGTCPVCGWWRYLRVERNHYSTSYGTYSSEVTSGAYGVLKNFSLADVSLPIAELRRYLIARFEARLDIHPRLLEEIVGAVFRDAGYRIRVTAYSGDGGVDVILDGPFERTIGVQVKRYRRTIEVAQIREFAGALFIKGYTRGVFVTTSDFTSGARGAAREATRRGIAVKLMNASQLYDAMKIHQRPPYQSFDEWQMVTGSPSLHVIQSTAPVYEP